MRYNQFRHRSLSISIRQGFSCELLLVPPLLLALVLSSMASRQEPVVTKAQDKCPVDTALFNTIEEY